MLDAKTCCNVLNKKRLIYFWIIIQSFIILNTLSGLLLVSFSDLVSIVLGHFFFFSFFFRVIEIMLMVITVITHTYHLISFVACEGHVLMPSTIKIKPCNVIIHLVVHNLKRRGGFCCCFFHHLMELLIQIKIKKFAHKILIKCIETVSNE